MCTVRLAGTPRACHQGWLHACRSAEQWQACVVAPAAWLPQQYFSIQQCNPCSSGTLLNAVPRCAVLAGPNVWHERWGEDYDAGGDACVKWTDKWAERLLPGGAREQWGDKWHEAFANGRGEKNGEVSGNAGRPHWLQFAGSRFACLLQEQSGTLILIKDMPHRLKLPAVCCCPKCKHRVDC